MKRFLSLSVLVVAALALTATSAFADSFQGFETDTSGWGDGGDYGTITRVASGTGGITSAAGAYHAAVEGTPGKSAPYTNFGGYSSVWPGGWSACIDVYLDTGWAAGSGFDYSVAANKSDGNHLRDFIFHVAKDTSSGDLIVAGDNNTNFNTREDLDTLANYEVIDTSGWYTFEHVFYDDGGVLSVDLNLYDAGGTKLFTETRSNVADLISGVGGNRYGWFTFVDVDGGIAADNAKLSLGAPVPEPSTLATLGLALACVVGVRRRRARLAS